MFLLGAVIAKIGPKKSTEETLMAYFKEWKIWRENGTGVYLGAPGKASFLADRSTSGNQPITRNRIAEKLDEAIGKLTARNYKAWLAIEMKYIKEYDGNDYMAKLLGMRRDTFAKYLEIGEHYLISKFD